jgi:hypothetical protein
VGPVAARGVAEGDWTSVWEAVIVDLLSGGSIRRCSSCATAAFEIGIDADGAGGDLPRDCGSSIDAIDGEVTGPLALDGEPRN